MAMSNAIEIHRYPGGGDTVLSIRVKRIDRISCLDVSDPGGVGCMRLTLPKHVADYIGRWLESGRGGSYRWVEDGGE